MCGIAVFHKFSICPDRGTQNNTLTTASTAENLAPHKELPIGVK